jgi:peroxiredoxin
MKTIATFAFLTVFAAAAPAMAELSVGTTAPDFDTQAAMAGKAFEFNMKDARTKGPVVLYFYPAAFTPGCTQEAHLFAESIDEFHKMGATVVGVSADGIDKLKEFSVSECKEKFAVAADPDMHIIKEYDAVMDARPQIADRISYVIAPDGKILMAHTDRKPDSHVELSLAAVKKWHDSH